MAVTLVMTLIILAGGSAYISRPCGLGQINVPRVTTRVF